MATQELNALVDTGDFQRDGAILHTFPLPLPLAPDWSGLQRRNLKRRRPGHFE
jgi:hypothetical protein